jgi:hypothetical protein
MKPQIKQALEILSGAYGLSNKELETLLEKKSG